MSMGWLCLDRRPLTDKCACRISRLTRHMESLQACFSMAASKSYLLHFRVGWEGKSEEDTENDNNLKLCSQDIFSFKFSSNHTFPSGCVCDMTVESGRSCTWLSSAETHVLYFLGNVHWHLILVSHTVDLGTSASALPGSLSGQNPDPFPKSTPSLRVPEFFHVNAPLSLDLRCPSCANLSWFSILKPLYLTSQVSCK